MQQKNFLTFLALAFLLLLLWLNIKQRIWPPPPQPDKQAAAEKKEAGEKPADKAAAPVVAALPPAPQETDPGQLIRLVSKDPDAHFPLVPTLDPLGAGVREIIARKFQEADSHGRPVRQDADRKVPQPLALVPAEANRDNPSYLFFHFDVNDPNDDKPVDTLGRTRWKVLGDKDNPVVEDVVEQYGAQRRRLRVSFQNEAQGVTVTKTYSLVEGDYHLGLEVKLALAKGAKDVKFRYQMTGAHGLPVEGKWYTSIFRNALIGEQNVEKHGIVRDLQDLRQISHWGGGKEVRRQDGYVLRYAGVAVQFFASVIVVDDQQDKQDILSRARPTLETWVAKGKVKSVSLTADGGSVVLTAPDRTEQTFLFRRDNVRLRALSPGEAVALIVRTGSYDEKAKLFPEVAVDVRDEAETHALWEDDVTVRVASEPVDLKSGGPEVVHKYLLYNGPVKVSLLGQKLGGERMASPELVSRYVDQLRLDTLTDYQSPGAMGTFASTIGWTLVVVKCTNFMHWVLGHIHDVIGSYGLCIIILTVLVRGLMFPISRKQAMTTMRMQALAPELKKLQEKYKDDRQGMGAAQMELYRKHGVNPFGTCWFLLLQMPIFMGLYFALQESIHFRLAPFWPLWIKNLAAPDMLVWWSEQIPYISRVQDFGGFLYLGPYFNLLPVIAVALMIAQQKMMTPPPADEQQAMQQKMMKYMMIFFGLMFYKVAAGLCVYFIASSVWGFCERKLLPKTKAPEVGEISSEGLFQRMLRRAGAPAAGDAAASTAVAAPGNVTPGSGKRRKQGRNRRRPGQAGREERGGPAAGTVLAADASALQKFRAWCRGRREGLRDWWSEVLKQAQKRG
ncbi:MAG TPA: YidC/Oxa1 family insertase periplasmic-domain containing protein [Gemmataceae bacterium]|nr:YidC/Oxa1 family insertase periplasmic-domain containing protein [Gemmataceae bacterium]